MSDTSKLLVAPMTEKDIEQMDAYMEEMDVIDKLRARLPMFFTSRGGVRSGNNLRISSKNFQQVTDTIDRINKEAGKPLTVKTPDYTVTLPAHVADELRKHKQISVLVIAGLIDLDNADH